MALALVLATLVGLSLGLFGGGGSILSVVILSFVLGMPPKTAAAASLLIAGVTSTAALIAQRGSTVVSIRAGVAFGVAGMVGAFAGGRLAAPLPEAVLLTAFGVVTLLTSLAMLTTTSPEAHAQYANEERPVRVPRTLLFASSLGIVTGMLGAGGGGLIVPALVLHGRMPMKRAVPTSLVLIGLLSFAGFAGQLGHVSLDWTIVAPFTLMATVGSVLGGTLRERAPQEFLRRGFASLALLLTIILVVQQLVAAGGTFASPIFNHVDGANRAFATMQWVSSAIDGGEPTQRVTCSGQVFDVIPSQLKCAPWTRLECAPGTCPTPF